MEVHIRRGGGGRYRCITSTGVVLSPIKGFETPQEAFAAVNILIRELQTAEIRDENGVWRP